MDTDWNWIGARWWKFDFHNHTPASDDYGKGPDQNNYKQISPKDWLLNYMRAEIDCIAVTDHNSGVWIDRLKQALLELADEGNSDYRPLYIFPGVEITVHGNIHILAIFPYERTTSDIDTLLGAIKFRCTKGTSNGCSECSAVEVLDEIQKEGGIAIPAHVDEENGLFTVCSGNTLEQVLNHGSVIAIEVKNLPNEKPPLYIDKKLNWAEVLGTDSHHPSGVQGQYYPGSHFTWVKMSKPSFEGFKLAIIDDNLSIKRSDNYFENPNRHGILEIEGIKIENAKFIGRDTSFNCRFNPWLNTIIGGRGTGKSTVVEFLRIALNRKDELPESLRNDFTKYSQISNERKDDGLLIENTFFTVCFRKDGVRFRVRWSASDNCSEIEEETSQNEWVPAEGDIKQRFPIRIYSQKQIFELAKRPHSLLQVVDNVPEVNFYKWNLEWNELVSKFLSIKAQEREIQAGLQEESVVRGQLSDVKRKLQVFETAGHADILNEYQFRQDQEKTIEIWENEWNDLAEQVKEFAKTLVIKEINPEHFSLGKDEDKELIDEISQIQATFKDIQQGVIQIASQIDSCSEQWSTRKVTLKITEKIVSASNNYTTLLSQLSDVGADDPSDYGQFVTQRQQLEAKLKEFRKQNEILLQLRYDSTECLKQIHEHRIKITQSRQNFLKNTLEDNSYVQIEVIPYGNKDTVEEDFRNLIDRSNGGFDRDIGNIEDNEGVISLLYIDNEQTMDEKIAILKNTILEIYSGNSAAIESTRDRRFLTHIQGLTPEQIDRVQCWYPADSLDVKYSIKDGNILKPLEQGSPGQKTAAILAFILSYGNEPLILDQPEDDLDNHLIYSLIVNQLRDIKQLRQIIVVTHNANIVVNGDSENVIVLDVRSGQTKVVTQDCLQELSVRGEICRIMEGGKEAFEQRYKRINAGR